ncbi:MAG: LysE family translocator [Devosia marina]|jgi:threonine/homoserine/homoserine lactone efflux protein|uniref:LysE family transporter n=2 Tax=Devosia TaxID=46913 RepID=A0A7X3FRF9_9HYPH|nr:MULTISPECIES: LysE family translocator [Devosia]MBB4053399.1 threonine/homoserine/homoserine lactone efflux protein [Devosia subaequoris]MCP1210776.1 LysE family translocator [Devosia subaequoris]MVS99432.1 LysE family transporter [Devosia marina]
MPAFIPDLPVILAFALAAFVLAVTPGPDMALFVSRTMNWGRSHGYATVLGAITGIGIHTMLVAFGISVLIVTAPAAFWVLKIVGALYLVWLAIQAIRDGGGMLVVKQAGKQPSWRKSYLTGLGINLTNPKIALFFVTFLPQFVSAADPHAAGKLLFLGFEFVVVSIPVVIAIVLFAEWLTRTLKENAWVGKALNWSFAAVFMAFAATILLAEGRK